jgi:hypothetical protein
LKRHPLSETAAEYRRTIWVTVVAAVLAFVIAILGARGYVPVTLGFAAIVLFGICVLVVALLGVKLQQQTREDLEKRARRGMTLILAATLGTQDNEALEKVARKGGDAGEAARMILQTRRAKADSKGHG